MHFCTTACLTGKNSPQKNKQRNKQSNKHFKSCTSTNKQANKHLKICTSSKHFKSYTSAIKSILNLNFKRKGLLAFTIKSTLFEIRAQRMGK